MLGAFLQLLTTFFRNYAASTPARLRILDAFLVYQVATALIQLVYVFLVGTFPFNSFLAGFFSAIGSAVLTASLRQQMNPASGFKVTPERAFAEFCVGNILLHLVVMNFMG